MIKSTRYGTEQNASMIISSPSSISWLISISSSFVKSATCPISLRYILTGLSLLLHSKSSFSFARSKFSAKAESCTFFLSISASCASFLFLIFAISAEEISFTFSFFRSVNTFLELAKVGCFGNASINSS